ncbi:MAG: ribonuclease HII [Pseudomonadota bacterium]
MKNRIVAGVDEAGRGPWAGPVYAAAVILDAAAPITGLRDSKKLTATAREALYQEVTTKARAFAIAIATVAEIDQLNILQASLLAMRRALLGLSIQPEIAYIDGCHTPKNVHFPLEAMIKGDSLLAEISAASILAKVARDAEMQQMEVQYPGYGFAKHKGYGTKQHQQALRRLGVLPIHRKSFAPVKLLLETS